MFTKVTDEHIDSYHRQGFCIFENVIPLTLMRELRAESEKGREIARQRSGESAQRLQPVVKLGLNAKPFEEFANLPHIHDALQAVLGPTAHYGGSPTDKTMYLGILYEPKAHPWCTMWHRDWRDNASGIDVRIWERRQLEIDMFNQVNCALYEDTCTWVVPGSHLRKDTPSEIRLFPERPISGPTIPENATAEEREEICLNYTRAMPHAHQAHLNPGDFMLYRNSLWHIGNYVPYKKRATIHDVIGSAEFSAWFKSPPYVKDETGKIVPMQNANVDTPEYKEWKASRRETVAAR